jgi:hypothetical protein
MGDQWLVKPWRRFAQALPAGVQQTLLDLPLGGLIIGGASFSGTSLPALLAASKGTIDIPSMGVAEIGQKGNAAAPASLQAWLKAGMLSNDPTNLLEIAGRQPTSLSLPIPVPLKRKKGLKSYDKKAKSSLVWLIRLDIPSFSFHVFSQDHE